jgi:transcriptional regulator with XRE-family HTH domain
LSRKKCPQLGTFLQIGARIREIRKKADLNQKEFGELFGVKPNTVSRWESGVLSDEETLKKIAEFGGKPYDWLIKGEDVSFVISEHISTAYDAQRQVVDRELLALVVAEVRRFLKTKRLKYDVTQESALVAAVYDHYHADLVKPDDTIIERYSWLIKRGGL